MGEADAIDPSTEMCFFDSDGEGSSSHAHPVELQPLEPARPVYTLAELGYEASRHGFPLNRARPIGALDLEFYTIRLPPHLDRGWFIALLAADGNTGLLYAWIQLLHTPRISETQFLPHYC